LGRKNRKVGRSSPLHKKKILPAQEVGAFRQEGKAVQSITKPQKGIHKNPSPKRDYYFNSAKGIRLCRGKGNVRSPILQQEGNVLHAALKRGDICARKLPVINPKKIGERPLLI